MLRRLLLLFGAVALVIGVWTAVGNTGQPAVCPSPSPSGSPTPFPSATPSPSPSPSPTGLPGPSPTCPPAYPLDVSVPGPGDDVAIPPLSSASDSGLSAGEIAVFMMGFVLPIVIAVAAFALRGRQKTSP